MPKQRTREKTNPATKTIIIGLVSFFFFPFLAIVTAGMAHSIADGGLVWCHDGSNAGIAVELKTGRVTVSRTRGY
jgi:hypothetical protein